jgi:hypothetical protein
MREGRMGRMYVGSGLWFKLYGGRVVQAGGSDQHVRAVHSPSAARASTAILACAVVWWQGAVLCGCIAPNLVTSRLVCENGL